MTGHRNPRRSTLLPVVSVHTDGTPCGHRYGPNARPREGKDCPGRAGYAAGCEACRWTQTYGLRTVAEDARRNHRCTKTAAA